MHGVGETMLQLKRAEYAVADETCVLMVTDFQTAGRGQRGTSWEADAGCNLLFGFTFVPHRIKATQQFALSEALALAVCEALSEYAEGFTVKWPNDVLADGKKLCGILSEAVTGKNGFEALVLGVGVNVAQADLSRAGQPAVSLKMLGIALTPEEMLQRILDRFFEGYEQVVNRGFESIREAYLARFPYIGKPVTIRYGAQEAAGTVQTLSPRGTLLLQTPQGVTEISIGDMMV